MKKILKLFIALTLLVNFGSWCGSAYAVACTSVATGNWSALTTWGAAGVGCSGATGTTLGTPGAADTVTIASPHLVTADVITVVGAVTINAGATLNIAGFNWTVNGATNVSGTLGHTNTGGNEIYIGLLTINSGGVWDNTVNENMTLQGGLTNNGTFTAGTTGRYTFTTNAQNIGGLNPITMANIRVNTNAVLTNTGTLTVSTALTTSAGTGTLINAANSTLNLGGTSTVTTLTATAIPNSVNYTGAAQTIKPTAYYHLGLSGSGAKTMTTVTTIGGNLSVAGTATLASNAAFTVTGALNYSSTGVTTLTAATPISIGSYNQTAGIFTAGANTITVTGTGVNTWGQTAGTFTSTGAIAFTGVAPQIGAAIFNNLILNVGIGNTATQTGNVLLNGTLTLTSGRISTATNTLEVSTSCAAVSGSANSYVIGNLRLHYPPLNPGTTTCTFPIGDVTAYTPAIVAMTNVTSTLVNSTLTARTYTPDHADTTANLSGIVASKSVNRYWTLTPNVLLTFGTYAATFNFVAGDIDAGALTANFKIRRKNAGAWSSPTMGASNPLNTTAIGITQANGFGEFAIGETVALSVTKTATLICDPVNGTSAPKNIPSAVVRWTITVTNSGITSVNLATISDLINFNTTPDANLITGAGGAAGCISATGTPESSAGKGFKLAISGTPVAPATTLRPTISYPKFFTTVADADAAAFSAGTVTIDYALGFPAEGVAPNAYTAGELKPGEVATFYFNVTVN